MQREYLVYFLERHDKSWDNTFAIVGNNCSANTSLATSVGLLLVGCASHCFNPAIKDKSGSSLILVEKVYVVAEKAKMGIYQFVCVNVLFHLWIC